MTSSSQLDKPVVSTEVRFIDLLSVREHALAPVCTVSSMFLIVRNPVKVPKHQGSYSDDPAKGNSGCSTDSTSR